MKKILFSLLMIFFFIDDSALAAEVFLAPGEKISIGDTDVYCQNNEGESIEVISSVDLECINVLYDDHTGFPKWEEVILWAYEDCRTAPLNQDECITVSSTNNQQCYLDLTRTHGGAGFPTSDELKTIQNACKDVVYECKFYPNAIPIYLP